MKNKELKMMHYLFNALLSAVIVPLALSKKIMVKSAETCITCITPCGPQVNLYRPMPIG